MKKNINDLKGRSFGQWTVLSRGEKRNGRTMWNCRCECGCGTERPVSSSNLKGGKTNSCGRIKGNPAFKPRLNHGASREPWYPNWLSMVSRMTNPKDPAYEHYVLHKGLSIDKTLLTDPWAFIDEIGRYPGKGYTVDRIDNAKGYVKGNLRWLTKGEQNKNKGIYINNKSGVSGITIDRKRNVWEARIYHENKTYFVGRYEKLDDAIAAQNERKKELGIKVEVSL